MLPMVLGCIGLVVVISRRSKAVREIMERRLGSMSGMARGYFVYMLAELCFYVYYRHHIRNIQWYSGIPKNGPHRTPKGRRWVLTNMLDVLCQPGQRRVEKARANTFIRGWFSNVPLERILRGNLFQWFTWALFYKHPAWLTMEETREMESLLGIFEQRTGLTFEYGFDRSVTCMRPSLDKVVATHRPLWVYLMSSVANSAGKLVLRYQGFTRHRVGGFAFWWRGGRYRKGRTAAQLNSTELSIEDAQSRVPVVFFHGLGFGLCVYLQLFNRLWEKDVFLIELPHIATRLWESHPSPRQLSTSVKAILQEFDFSKASFIGHSYGTMAVAWVIKNNPGLVHSAVLIDPVCLLLNHAKVCKNFLYSTPTKLSSVFTYFVAQEPGIAHTFYRHFWWQSCALWLKELPYADLSQSLLYFTDPDYAPRPMRKELSFSAISGRPSIDSEVYFWQHQKGDQKGPHEQDHSDHSDSDSTEEVQEGENENGEEEGVGDQQLQGDVQEEKEESGDQLIDLPQLPRVTVRERSSSSGNYNTVEACDPTVWTAKRTSTTTTIPSRARKCSEPSIDHITHHVAGDRTGRPRIKLGIVLSGMDDLVPTSEIIEHVTAYATSLPHVRLLHFPNHQHGQFLLWRCKQEREDIIKLVHWLDAP